MVIDVCSKIFSSVMNARVFKLLAEHGTRFQFGGTPEHGCRDGLICPEDHAQLAKKP
jgi:hypothetical protein